MGEEETEKYARMFACALPHVDFPMGFPASPISAHNMNLMPTDYQHGFDQLAKTARPITLNIRECGVGMIDTDLRDAVVSTFRIGQINQVRVATAHSFRALGRSARYRPIN